jgi:hypothetical protein
MADRNGSFFNTNTFVPKEYLYPEDSLLKGKLFVMANEGDGLLNYSEKKVSITALGRVLMERRYGGNSVDSTIYLNNRMIETYSNLYDHRLLKGEIIHDTLIQDGTRFGEDFQETIYHTSKSDVDISSHSHFLKDTIIGWNQLKLECFVVVGEHEIKNKPHNDPAAIKAFTLFNTTYFAKGIGLIRFTTEFNSEMAAFNLKEIRSSASQN